jgi:hypothetical protein
MIGRIQKAIPGHGVPRAIGVRKPAAVEKTLECRRRRPAGRHAGVWRGWVGSGWAVHREAVQGKARGAVVTTAAPHSFPPICVGRPALTDSSTVDLPPPGAVQTSSGKAASEGRHG